MILLQREKVHGGKLTTFQIGKVYNFVSKKKEGIRITCSTVTEVLEIHDLALAKLEIHGLVK